MTLAASTRMYNVSPGARDAWHRLLGAVGERAGVALRIVEHPHPLTLPGLWSLPDLGCAFMCGWPLAQEHGQRPVIAAPVPVGGEGPRYRSVFVVRAASAFHCLTDVFGRRFAFNAKSSHSGWNMPCAYVAGLGGRFGAEIGPCGPHQLSAAAVVAGDADVAALDSLVWALLCRHDTALAGSLRVIDQTSSQPCPPLIGSAALGEHDRTRLRDALLGLSDDPDGRRLLADVCLERFEAAELSRYDETLAVGA